MASNFASIANENKTNKEQSVVFLASGTQDDDTVGYFNLCMKYDLLFEMQQFSGTGAFAHFVCGVL